ncbi:hypothetical protein D9615_007826 [Tricholomella constricta]|uniref:Transaldolase n=1 Tax=Tricholomella constricta TaxID=117010 RepID=A0A8H5H4U2_9AGAR|nr:hypothetical protein D9615_007826 [Tricholomella constricta]
MATLGNTIGAAFLGTVFAAVLYGVTNLQVYLYFQNYRNDWRVQKYSVALLWVLDTIHLSLTIAAVYHYLIDSFGILAALELVAWAFKLQIAINVIIICVVQTLYAIRVWKLGRHYQRIWPILVAVVVASGYAIGIILAVKTYNIKTFADLDEMSWVVYASFSWSTGIDIVIATAMCFYLIRSKSGFSGTNNKIMIIIRMTLISGFLTSACSLAALITYAAMPYNLVFLGIEFLLTKLYINSFLAMLNARQSVRDRDTSPGNSLSITKIMNIRTTTSSHVVTSGEPFESEDSKNVMHLSPLGQYRNEFESNPSVEDKRPDDDHTRGDATTNPSLVFAALQKPEYAHLVEDAVRYAMARSASRSVEAQTELACDYLLVQVGIQILNIIPGRVSISVDPRLANDHDAIIAKGRNLVSIFEELGYPRERVLIKIPATYSGILAAQALETPIQLPNGTSSKPIHTNATLIFGLVQALACAQAGISVISPFIGRVKDWWAVRHAQLNNHNGNATQPQPLSEHPGIQLVRTIRSAYTSYGHSTSIMAAGFRSVDEIVELGRHGSRGGPDLVTLPPELLDGLRKRDTQGVVHPPNTNTNTNGKMVHDITITEKAPEPRYIALGGDVVSAAAAEAAFVEDLGKEGIAVDKVPEGLAKFSVDAKGLEDLLRGMITRSIDASARL